MSNITISLGLTGGGTAGHVLPHFAVVGNTDSPLAQMVKNGELKVYYFGGHAGMERSIVSQNRPDWIYIPVRTGKLRRYFSLQNFIDPFNILLGFVSACYLMRKHRIRCLFSKGGFVSAPVVWAAWLNRVPVVIHESDATPALATKLTLPFARRALVSFQETMKLIPATYKSKMRVAGIPLRSELFSKNRADAFQHFKLDSSRPTLLVFGGSLGAEGLNKKFAPVISRLSHDWNIIHIVGKGKRFDVPDLPNYRQYEFLSEDMALAYSIADVALCRAGASSIFELAAARIPMILVPLGLHQSRGDQIINAKIFSDKGWALWSDEADLSPEKIIELIENIRAQSAKFREKLSHAPGEKSATQIAVLLRSILLREQIAEPF